MRISKIRLKNYRQFADVTLSLQKAKSSDLHLFIGSNGTGKTNLLNALSWCLYRDESHLTDKSKGLPLLNINALTEANHGEDECVSVEVSFETDEGSPLIFRREEIFKVYKDSSHPSPASSTFRVSYPDSKGNIKFAEGEEAAARVQRLIPQRIREYFFFDGERLDSYFKEEAGQRISLAVFEIAQIDLLATVERKLDDLLTELERDAGKISPRIKIIRDKLDRAEKNRNEFQDRLDECDRQLRLAEKSVEEYSEKLRSLPDVETLERERTSVEAQISSVRQLLEEKEREKGELLFRYGIVLNIHDAVAAAIQIIEQKRERGEIPPAVNRQLLENTLAELRCSVCGRQLDAQSQSHAEKLLQDIKFSSEIASELLRIESPLRILLHQTHDFEKDVKSISRDIGHFRGQADELLGKKEELEGKFVGFNIEAVSNWAKSRRQFETNERQLRENKGRLHAELDSAKKEVQNLEMELNVELHAEKKLKELQRQVDFCSEAREASRTAKSRIVNEVRQQIESRTNDTFRDLIWKRVTYDHIAIDSNYSISLNHMAGYSALGSASAAERELLALAFTLALHEVSGFDAPLVIDTPVARVSDRHRESFAKVLAKVGKSGKQILLLFTPDEYTLSVSKWLDQDAASKHEFVLDSTERVARLEDLSGKQGG